METKWYEVVDNLLQTEIMNTNIQESFLALKQLDLNIANDTVSNDDAALIIEIVLDSLVEVGNGVSEEELHKAADYLFAFRDKWFKRRVYES